MSCYVYDAELEAMHTVLKAVGDLSNEERERVFDWVSNRVWFLAKQKAAEAQATPAAEPVLAEVA